MAALPAFPSEAVRGNYASGKFNLVAIYGSFQVFIQARLAIEEIYHLVRFTLGT